MAFRNGMELIGMGQDPLKSAKVLQRDGLRWHDKPEELAARTVPLGCQIATANVAEFCRQHDGIDWLGFMGLGLWRIQNAPVNFENGLFARQMMANKSLLLRLISNSWSREFYELLVAESQNHKISSEVERAIHRCKEIIEGDESLFDLADLETMERAIISLDRPPDNTD
jgi:hypothetical protein